MSDNYIKNTSYPKAVSPFGLKVQLLRLLWSVARVLLYIPFGGRLLNWWRIFILRCFGAKIGRGSIVYSSTRIWGPWNMEIGERTCIGPRVDFYCADKIIIGNKVTISQDSCLCTASHRTDDINKPWFSEAIHIDDYAWVCARAMVLPGCHIAKGGVLGAAAVLSRNIPEWEIYAGNPAHFIKQRTIKQS